MATDTDTKPTDTTGSTKPTTGGNDTSTSSAGGGGTGDVPIISG